MRGPSDETPKPLITAVMVTGAHEARYALAHIAIDCFRTQTYEKRELLIINHGSVSLQTDEPTIRELRVIKKASDTIGDLRNIALGEARGELVICWDDDDWYAPERMAVQCEAYHASGDESAVVLRNGIRFNILDRSAKYVRVHEGMPGSILHPTRVPFRYESIARSSDEAFLAQFTRKTVIDNKPSLYIRTYHGLNLWSGDHIMKGMVGPAYRDVFQVSTSDKYLLGSLSEQHRATYDRLRLKHHG